MLSDDEELLKKVKVEPKKLEPLSIEELRDYIKWLEVERQRTETEIMRKQLAQQAASLLFGKP